MQTINHNTQNKMKFKQEKPNQIKFFLKDTLGTTLEITSGSVWGQSFFSETLRTC